MAEVNTGNGGNENKKGKPKKISLRVDFTPMVDMNMLLITFFMFCTTLSKPQMMNLVMPTKDKSVVEGHQTQTEASKTITLLLAENDVIYYYSGKLEDASLMKTDYSPTGLRAILVNRNGEVIRQMAELRLQKQNNEISNEVFEQKSSEIRDAKGGQVVVIKPMEVSTYENLVNVLDEMQICSIGMYAIVDITDGDKVLLDNYLKQGVEPSAQ